MGGGRILGSMMASVSSGMHAAAAATMGAGRPHGVLSLSSSSSGSSPASLSIASKEGDKGRNSLSASLVEDWESMVGDEAAEEVDAFWFADRYVFGPAPSVDEVLEAVSTINQVFVPLTFPQIYGDESSYTVGKEALDKTSTSSGIMLDTTTATYETDSTESALQRCNTSTVKTQKVIESFRSLQTNPSIQVKEL